jgi:hypothetical protein
MFSNLLIFRQSDNLIYSDLYFLFEWFVRNEYLIVLIHLMHSFFAATSHHVLPVYKYQPCY